MLNLQKQSLYRLVLSDKGSILFLSLWSLCLLSIFAVSLGYGARQKIIVVQRLDERSKLRYIAEAGVRQAIIEVKRDDEQDEEESEKKDYDSLNDSWCNNAGVFSGRRVGDGIFNVSYRYLDGNTGLVGTRYGLVDEERKININKADETLLRNLFCAVLNFSKMDAQEFAASIIDWRDSDSELSIPMGSAEDYDYRNREYSYEAKDAEFEVLEELLLVSGITREIFEGIKDYVTIYGNGKININTTSKEVLLALGLRPYVVEKIFSFRQGDDGIIGTLDDNVLKKSSDIVPKISQFADLSDSELAEFSNISNQYLVTKSENFIVKSIAKLNNRKNTTEVTCVINRSGDILYWREP